MARIGESCRFCLIPPGGLCSDAAADDAPIPIPLQNGEPEPTLDLQAAFDLTYDRAAYQDSLDYSHALQPPAGTEDAAWISELLTANV